VSGISGVKGLDAGDPGAGSPESFFPSFHEKSPFTLYKNEGRLVRTYWKRYMNILNGIYWLY
jgi:hypothetical protein